MGRMTFWKPFFFCAVALYYSAVNKSGDELFMLNYLKSCVFLCCAIICLAGCQEPVDIPSEAFSAMESRNDAIEKLDDRLDAIIDLDASLEVLADGFEWTEGPLWIPDQGQLLFSDIPNNTIHSWSEEAGLGVFLRPAGYNQDDPFGKELGTNGLLLNEDGQLVMCNHGLRAVTRLNDNFTHSILADMHEGRRLNSPNDGVFKSNGDLYFTDPSYGLEGVNNSVHKEIPYNGVYRLTPEGEVSLLTTDLTNPNGIGFSPDESVLYVAQSDPEAPIWRAFDVNEDGSLSGSRLFFDATAHRQAGGKGLPDGLAVDQSGNIFATGPGGVLIFAPDGTHLGTINTGEATANCAFGDDGSTLYITADMFLMRIRVKTTGLGFDQAL